MKYTVYYAHNSVPALDLGSGFCSHPHRSILEGGGNLGLEVVSIPVGGSGTSRLEFDLARYLSSPGFRPMSLR